MTAREASGVRIGAADLPADGEMNPVQVGDRELLLARVGEEYFAVDNLCSHAEGWLDMGFLIPERCEVRCPLHEGRFDLRTGAATHEPATEPIAAFTVTVVDGDVFVGTEPR